MFEKKKNGRPSVRPDLATLSMLYQTMTAKEIAHQYNVSESTVRSWVSRARKQQEREQQQRKHVEETMAKATRNEDKTDAIRDNLIANDEELMNFAQRQEREEII